MPGSEGLCRRHTSRPKPGLSLLQRSNSRKRHTIKHIAKNFSYISLAFFLALVVAPQLYGEDLAVPQLHEHVTDFTNSLEFSAWRSLETELKQFEDSTSTQIVVLLIPSLQGEEITDYSIKVAEANKIGVKGRDNGLLILIAKEEKQIRFEVGYGLEGSLPDGLCDQIIRNEMRPRFREGDFYGGVKAGVDAAIMATRGEYKAEGRARDRVTGWGSALLMLVSFFLSPL